MGIQTITAIGPLITDQDIKSFEKTIGGRLPASYRRFLLTHNGGRPEPHFSKETPLAAFYGIKAQEKYNDLLANYRRMHKWLPKEVIPIGGDVFGDKVCLAIKGKNRGKIYGWDHEGRPENIDPRIEFPWLELSDDYVFKGDDWPGQPDLVLIADSFTEFLDDFHDFIPDEPKVKRKRPK